MQISNPQFLEHLTALLFEAPGFLFVHAFAQRPQLGQQAFVLWSCSDGVAEGAESQQQIPLGTASLQHLFQHGEPWGHSTLLPDEFHPEAIRASAFSLPEGFSTGKHLQQSRLAGAIRPNQSEPLPFADMEVEIGKKSADAEILGGTHQADQAHEGGAGN